MLDRTSAPSYQVIDQIKIPQVQTYHLDNGLPLHVLNAGEQPILRLEIVFAAGNYFESQPGASFFTVKMLGEGTRQHTYQEIIGHIDRYGAFIDFNHGVDRTSISLYTLSKHLEKLTPLLIELITEPSFPDREMQNLKNNTRQNLRINQQKNGYVASSTLRKLLFGEAHAYGRNLTETMIQAIGQEHLQEHFQHGYYQQKFDLILVGKVDETTLKKIKTHWGSLKIQNTHPSHVQNELPPVHTPTQHTIEKPDSLQSSIRMGCLLFDKRHPDYNRLCVLNEIFGGYFGSRLMKNIREDKGYTYGIYSNLVMFHHHGYWMISTDVKRAFTQHTIDEILKEANRLKEELVDAKELETVKNYMLGSFASSLGTPFDLADLFKSIYFNNLEYSFYDQYLQTIRNISAEEILATAEQYLNTEQMLQVVVGGF